MNYFFIAIAVMFIIYILIIIRKRQFSIEESIFWVFGAMICLILAIFPKLIDKVSLSLNIAYPPSMLFLLAIMFLLLINFRSTKKISKLNDKVIDLAQRIAILQYEADNSKKSKDENKENKNNGE